MPPFTRGRSARGGIRGRGIIRGRGRDSGPRGNATSNGTRSTFYSTRIEEEPGSGDEKAAYGESPERDDDGIDPEALSSGSEYKDNTSPVVQPYNSLLQSLNANVQRGPPQWKKRRIDHGGPQEQLHAKDDESHEPEDETSLESGSDVSEGGYTSDGEDEIGNTERGEDSFSVHLGDVDKALLELNIKEIKQNDFYTRKVNLPAGLSCFAQLPRSSGGPEALPTRRIMSIKDISLKQKLTGPASKLFPAQGIFPVSETFPHLKFTPQVVSRPIFDYKDVFYPVKTSSNADDLRKLSCIHLLNHIYMTRDSVLKNNTRLVKENEAETEYRDQGFTRPKVLVLVPTRDSCVKYVDLLTTLFQPEQQENKKRFQDSYAQGEERFSGDKPEDFRELFAGNDDDMFKLGIKFTRKTVKYFSQFYSSDIIFASPLGLRMAIGAEGDKKQDYDFLSSIEILIVDQADALNMQNWEHVEYMFEHLNLQPREAHGCDFSRVRSWYLDGNAKYIRQTLIFSAFNFPALNRLYLSRMLNVAGRMKYSLTQEGAMLELGLSVKQTFSRFDYTNPASEPDDRFNYFTTAVVPILSKQSDASVGGRKGLLIYLPTYADFVRVRNYISTSSTTQNISFGSISEYTSVREVARARSHFFTGRHSVLLYTERAHHFRRYHLRGAKKVIMYGLPENPIFYKEIAGGFLGSSIAEAKVTAGEASIRILFSKLDILKLERIVGTQRLPSLLLEKGGDTFDFV